MGEHRHGPVDPANPANLLSGFEGVKGAKVMSNAKLRDNRRVGGRRGGGGALGGEGAEEEGPLAHGARSLPAPEGRGRHQEGAGGRAGPQGDFSVES